MSTWHKEITKSLADSVSAVLSDMKEDQKSSQNKMLKKSKGEPAGQIKPKQALPEEEDCGPCDRVQARGAHVQARLQC